jgi:hypothetical protein
MRVVSGRSGKKAKPKIAMGMVIRPSIMKDYQGSQRMFWLCSCQLNQLTHLQPGRPATPSIVLQMAVIRIPGKWFQRRAFMK